LISKGCRVDVAGSGMEGLGKLKKGRFDLVIADTGISDVGGNAFITKSRKINRDLSIVLIAEHEGYNRLDYSDESGVDLTIMKPIDVNMAVKQVSEVLMCRC
jgi:DNA-binding response OmpR family regulator